MVVSRSEMQEGKGKKTKKQSGIMFLPPSCTCPSPYKV